MECVSVIDNKVFSVVFLILVILLIIICTYVRSRFESYIHYCDKGFAASKTCRINLGLSSLDVVVAFIQSGGHKKRRVTWPISLSPLRPLLNGKPIV